MSSSSEHCGRCGAVLHSTDEGFCARCVIESGIPADETLASDAKVDETLAMEGGAGSTARPRLIGAYRVLGALGRGGMGEVFLARHERLGRTVAIKALPETKAGDARARERLLREARATSSLNHPNIVTVHDLIADHGHDYIVMERVEGETLSDLLAREPLELDRALRSLRQITRGLAAAHAAGIVHRDLKPSNVMVTGDGRVKLMDFGLAKISEDDTSDGADPLTRLGAVLGTTHYMSPEQARGEWVAAPSDVFSWGVLAYETLTGSRPFDGKDRIEVLHRVCHSEPKDLRDLRPDLPAEIADLIQAALQKNAAARPTSAELLAGLDALATSTELSAHSRAASPPLTARALPARRKLVVSLGVGALLVAAILGGWWLIHGFRAPETARSADPLVLEGTPSSLTEQGEALLQRFDRPQAIDRAIAAFQRALEQDPTFAPAYAGLGWAYYHRYEETFDPHVLEQARANADAAVEQSPHLARPHVYLAAILGEQGEHETAVAQIQEALEIEPENAAAYRELAMIEVLHGDLEQAERAAQRAVELAPDSWSAQSVLGTVRYQQGRYEDAEAAFRRWATLTEDAWRPHANLAAVYQKLGRYDDSIAELQTALEIQPTAVVYTNLGTLYYFRGLFTKAADAFERAVDLKPGEYLHWANLGDGYRRLAGREQDAADAYRRAVQLVDAEIAKRPDDAVLQSRLALYVAKQGDVERAGREIARARELGGDSPGVLYRLTIAHELLGERAQALASLEAALEAGYPLDEFEREDELADLRRDVAFHRVAARWQEAHPVGEEKGEENR